MTARQQVLASFLELAPRLMAEIVSDRCGFNLESSQDGLDFDSDCRQIISACEGLSATASAALRVGGAKT